MRAGRRARERLSLEAARRIALGGQGFADAPPSRPADVAAVGRAIERMGLLQLDSVNVLCRSHYLPLYARLGPYRRATLDAMAWGGGRRELFEFWGHGASLLPVGMYPLCRWRMDAAARWEWQGWSPAEWARTWDRSVQAPWAVVAGMARLSADRPALVDEVLAVVTERGPVAARDADPAGATRYGHDPSAGRMWNWHDAKIVLEWLLCMGRVTTAARRNFERLYDLTARVLPAEILAAAPPPREAAQRDLLRVAARAHGIATERQLREYFHLRDPGARERFTELVAAEELIPAQVEGVGQRMYLWHEARVPARIEARALLSPFDPLIWDRDRTERLFGFRYRISLYTPAARRTGGYYVLPFLLGDGLVARVDVRADRRDGALVVPVANLEPGAAERQVAAALAEELRRMAGWLELERVVVGGGGDLAPALGRALL